MNIQAGRNAENILYSGGKQTVQPQRKGFKTDAVYVLYTQSGRSHIIKHIYDAFTIG